MKQIIQKFVDSGEPNGLLLLDMPTGSGKTYSVLQYIYESIAIKKSETKFFFITTLKKNLPESELRALFKKSEDEALFDEKFLRIPSNADSVLEGFTPEIDKKIPVDVKSWDEYKEIKNNILFLHKQNSSRDFKNLRKPVEDMLRDKAEPAFRKKLQATLSKAFPTVKQRLEAIKVDDAWKWVAKLYPAVFTKEKQIIFMSMDKFLVQNSTIVEPPYLLYNSSAIDGAVIFIDEFDATKETMLKNIIANGLHSKIDYVELFKDIHAALQTHDFPADLTRPSEQRKSSESKDQSLQSVIDGFKEKADRIYDEYSLNFSHKTKDITDNEVKRFLFQDHRHHAILDGRKSYIYTKSDCSQRINAIEYGTEKPAGEENNIQIMLGKIRGFITFFQRGVWILAINYQQRKREYRKPTDDEFTTDAALRSILEQFRLSRGNIDYLVSQILTSSHKSKNGVYGASYDLSFYEKGFRYYSFEDSDEFDMQSKIMMYSFQNTPEKILLRFCEKAKVIGISATATVPTNIGNFNIEYLKLKLGERFFEVGDDDKKRLRHEFESGQNGYSGVKIHAELLGSDTYSLELWEKLYGDRELAEHTDNKLKCEFHGTDDNAYNRLRIYRIASAFKQFLLHHDIKSFLCVLTKHPRKGDTVLNLNVLLEIFENISKAFKCDFDEGQIVQLDGEEYDGKKEEIIQRLGRGEKLFVISVYQTIGAGQNLQYPIPSDIKNSLICLNEGRKNDKKDFDAIYLDKPTHILVNLEKNLQEEDFAKYIYQVEYLQEACEISESEAVRSIKKAFNCYSTGTSNSMDFVNLYHRQSVVLMSTKIIIQAIGRICRTYMKPKNIYVYADNNIVDAIDPSVLDECAFNYEFINLANMVKEKCKPIEPGSPETEANLLSVRTNMHIHQMIGDWTGERMEKWKRLRKLVLRYPTVNMSALSTDERFIASNFYVRLPQKNNELYYNQQEDYSSISVSFEKNNKFPFAVSAESAKLDKLMQNPDIKKYFISKGYATEFTKDEYIMSPALCNNIYKGALGEIVGRLLFYRFTGNDLILEEIDDPDLFELFDFKVPESDIYVDFKNWQESSKFSDEEIVERIRKKAKKCGCKCVIVANVLASEYPIRKRKIDDFELVEIPAMIVEYNLCYHPAAAEEIRRCVREYSDQDE